MNGFSFSAKRTPRNQATRLRIAQTLLALLQERPLAQITTSELIEKSHVSRMTFYKYFGTKEEVLADYLCEIISAYRADMKQAIHTGVFMDERHICHCLRFLQQYRLFFLTLIRSNLYGLMIDALNGYMDAYVLKEGNYSKYELYYFAGALCNLYTKWLQSGMSEPPEVIARLVQKLLPQSTAIT